MLVVAAERRIVRGVDLVEVEVAGRSASCRLRFAVGVLVDGFDELIDFLVGHKTLEAAVELVGADVDDADAVVRVEHGDRIVRAHVNPVGDRFGFAGGQGVQQQAGDREIVDAIDLVGDGDLLLVVGMHFDQCFQAAGFGFRLDPADEVEGLGGHEAAGLGLLGAVADRVEADVADVAAGQLVENGQQVIPTFFGIGVDIDLLRGEGGPHETGLAAPRVVGERQARARTVNAGEVLFGGAIGEDARHGEEHRVVGAVFAALHDVLELLGFPGHVVDDGVDHDVVRFGQLGDVIPCAQARVDFGVVHRVESGVGAVERGEERQDVHAFVHAVEAGAQDVGHGCDGAVPQPVGIRDELDFVLHWSSFGAKRRTLSV